MELIFLKDLDGFVRAGVLKIGSVKFLNVDLSLVLGLESVTDSSLVDVFCLGQLLSQFLYLLPQNLVILCRVLVHLHFHLQNLGPLCEHQSR